MHLAFSFFLSEHSVFEIALSWVSIVLEFISDLASMPCSFPNIAPHREITISCCSFHWVSFPRISFGGALWWLIAFKLHFALFGRIMGAVSTRVACLPPFSIHPLASSALLSGDGDRSTVVVVLFWWRRLLYIFMFRLFWLFVASGCSLWAHFIIIFFYGVGLLLGFYGLSF